MKLYNELRKIGIIPRSALKFCQVCEPEESKFEMTLREIEEGVDDLY